MKLFWIVVPTIYAVPSLLSEATKVALVNTAAIIANNCYGLTQGVQFETAVPSFDKSTAEVSCRESTGRYLQLIQSMSLSQILNGLAAVGDLNSISNVTTTLLLMPRSVLEDNVDLYIELFLMLKELGQEECFMLQVMVDFNRVDLVKVLVQQNLVDVSELPKCHLMYVAANRRLKRLSTPLGELTDLGYIPTDGENEGVQALFRI